MRSLKKNTARSILVLAFFIPVIIMLTVYFFINIYPFGDRSLIMYWDIREQYSNYFEYLKNIFFSNNNFIYSFSKVLGGNFIGLTGYYLSSPLNILFVILNKLRTVEVILILTLLKLGLCGLTFNVFINYKNKITAKSLIFSTAYALMSYNIIYQQNIMWLDGIILLPIVALGIKKIIYDNNYLPYIISFFASVFSNYYIAFMIGIFSVLYFISELIINNKLPIKKFMPSFFKRTSKFLLSTVISIGLDSFFLIPIITSLAGSKGPKNLLENLQFEEDLIKTSKSNYVFESLFLFKDFFSKFFTGAFEWKDVMYGFPLVFCGISVFFLSVLYFFNGSIKLKKRLVNLSFLIFMLISCKFSILNNVWHGFNAPTGFPFRYSFIISFLIISIAYENMKNFLYFYNKKKYIILNLILFFALMIILKSVKYTHFVCYFKYYLIIIALTFALLLMSKRFYKISSFILFLMVSVDLGLNGYWCLKKYNFTDVYEFDNFKNENQVLYDKIYSNDKTFYRIEKNFHRTRNDNMIFAANGVTHYSSSEKNFIKEFIGTLGLEKFGKVYGAYGGGGTISVDSFLGIKYLLSYNTPNSYYKNNLDEKIYENPFSLPVAFAVNKKVEEVQFNGDNKFEYQNAIFSSMTGDESNIFTECKNVILIKENMKSFESDWGDTVYYKEDLKKDSYLSYFITVDSEDPLYLNFSSVKYLDASMVLNGENKDFNLASKSIFRLGQFKKGQILNIKLYPKGKYLHLKNSYFYQENVDLLKKHTDLLKLQPCELKKISSSHLTGTVNIKSEDEKLLFTIPYEDEWNITVDGKTCKKDLVFDALIAIPISSGFHTIELKYIPKGGYLGLLISLISFTLLIWIVFKNHKNKINVI